LKLAGNILPNTIELSGNFFAVLLACLRHRTSDEKFVPVGSEYAGAVVEIRAVGSNEALGQLSEQFVRAIVAELIVHALEAVDFNEGNPETIA